METEHSTTVNKLKEQTAANDQNTQNLQKENKQLKGEIAELGLEAITAKKAAEAAKKAKEAAEAAMAAQALIKPPEPDLSPFFKYERFESNFSSDVSSYLMLRNKKPVKPV